MFCNEPNKVILKPKAEIFLTVISPGEQHKEEVSKWFIGLIHPDEENQRCF